MTAMVGTVVARRELRLGDRHADRVAEALAQAARW